MKYIRTFLTLTLLATGAILMIHVHEVVAQEQPPSQTGLALRPAIVEVAGNPGTSSSHKLFVENTSDRALAVQLEAQTLLPLDPIVDGDRRSEFDASSWIEVNSTDRLFDTGEVEEITFTVAIPEDANAGGHYAILALRPLSAQSDAQATNSVPEIGVAVFITVAGDIVEEAALQTDNLIGARVAQGSTQKLSFDIANTGNVHILPSPRITITKDGKTVEVLTLQPQVVLPNTEKTFTAEWAAEAGYGQYAARAELTYGNQSIPLSSTEQSFWVVPPILAIIAVLAGLTLLSSMLIFRKNIPRSIAVLRGYAHGGVGPYRTKSAASSKHSKPTAQPEYKVPKHAPPKPVILGLPSDNLQDALNLLHEEEEEESTKSVDTEETDPKKQIARPVTPLNPRAIDKNSIKTTHITQTKSSTIVREAHSKLAKEPKSKTIKIPVTHHDELPTARQKSVKVLTKGKHESKSKNRKTQKTVMAHKKTASASTNSSPSKARSGKKVKK